jgi:hypothetical protein
LPPLLAKRWWLERLGFPWRLVAEPTIGHNADGRLEVFVVGSDHALHHNWQLSPGGVWSGWASLGGSVSQPTIGQNGDGRLEAFVVGSDRALWHNWQLTPSGVWSGWASLGARSTNLRSPGTGMDDSKSSSSEAITPSGTDGS